MRGKLLGSMLFVLAAGCSQQVVAQIILADSDLVSRNGLIDGFTGPHMVGSVIPGRNGVEHEPYSMVETTTDTRTLADGTTIKSSHVQRWMRDSQGRERTESGEMKDGQWEAQTIALTDPLAHTRAVLRAKWKTATVTHMPERFVATPEMEVRMAEARAKHEAEMKERAAEPNRPGRQDLGEQNIAGVAAHGMRTTIVIPAGREGNDREIKVVREVWEAVDLHIIVAMTTDDPRRGKVAMEVSDLQTSDPDPELFRIPADYKVFNREMAVAGSTQTTAGH